MQTSVALTADDQSVDVQEFLDLVATWRSLRKRETAARFRRSERQFKKRVKVNSPRAVILDPPTKREQQRYEKEIGALCKESYDLSVRIGAASEHLFGIAYALDGEECPEFLSPNALHQGRL